MLKKDKTNKTCAAIMCYSVIAGNKQGCFNKSAAIPSVKSSAYCLFHEHTNTSTHAVTPTNSLRQNKPINPLTSVRVDTDPAVQIESVI